MPKLKTRQSIAKRFKITKTGKILKKPSGQDHFNAREAGKITRNKRGFVETATSNNNQIRKALPYS